MGIERWGWNKGVGEMGIERWGWNEGYREMGMGRWGYGDREYGEMERMERMERMGMEIWGTKNPPPKIWRGPCALDAHMKRSGILDFGRDLIRPQEWTVRKKSSV